MSDHIRRTNMPNFLVFLHGESLKKKVNDENNEKRQL